VNKEREGIDELLDRVADGSGYGDPDARLNDDRKLQVLLAREVKESISQITSELADSNASLTKIGARLNWLTFFLVVAGLLNVAVLAYQVWGK
jgi:cytochrome c-type biogenesis protein CcmH/NrfG